jgi:hypothetical protein
VLGMKATAEMAIAFAALASLSFAQVAAVVADIPYDAAAPVFAALRDDLLPELLRSKSPSDRRAAWPGWVRERDQAIRQRLEGGERDSIVSLLVFGTTFTKQPRPPTPTLGVLGPEWSQSNPVVAARLEDFLAALASPLADERLELVRRHLRRRGIDLASPDGRRQAHAYLTESLRAATAELAAPSAVTDLRDDSRVLLFERTLFRDRGLSSDSSIFINLALNQALESVLTSKLLGAGHVRRAAIVGPGLDFADKHDGHDFYPPQTIQPFALADTLIRLGLADQDELRITTFDLSPKVNDHLEAARQRGDAGVGYVFVIPRNIDTPWEPMMVAFWELLGLHIGEPVEALPAPPNAGNVRTRAIRVRPQFVRAITPRDLNIVLQRLDPLAADERFDLIVATNVLVYYDIFDQSLALVNIATMLRPGGILLSNTRVFALPGIPMDMVGSAEAAELTVPGIGIIRDRVAWYRRQ